jgi:hypothetical protein
MKSKQFSFFFFLNVVFISIDAQNNESNRRLYDEKVLYRYGNTFKIGEEKFKFKQLGYEFKGSEVGLINYKIANKYRTISTIFAAFLW